MDLEEKPASLEKLEAASDKLAETAENLPIIVARRGQSAARAGKGDRRKSLAEGSRWPACLRLLSDANFLRIIASSELVKESGLQITKRAPPVVGALVALGIGLGGAAGVGAMLGPEGFALIKEVAGADRNWRSFRQADQRLRQTREKNREIGRGDKEARSLESPFVKGAEDERAASREKARAQEAATQKVVPSRATPPPSLRAGAKQSNGRARLLDCRVGFASSQ